MSEYAEFLQGLTYKPSDVKKDGKLVLRSSNIQNGQLSFLDNVFVKDEIVPDKIKTQENDVLMCVRNGSKALVGKTALIDKKHTELAWGAFMTVLRPKRNNTLLFQYLNSPTFKRQIFPDLETATVKPITMGTLNSVKLLLPQNDEQNKIAKFLKIIDNRIEKQQALVDALKLYKRGVLSQIFNQSLSFDGSATRWQKKTIGDIFAERCERANGDEELLAVTINAGIQKRDDIDKKDNSSENKSNYKKVYPGDIAYNTMRMWQGASGYSSFDGIVSPAYTVIYPIEPNKQNIVFWAYYFKDLDLIKKFQKYSQGLTSDTWNLKFAQLADIHIYEPPYETQCNIANFLTKFDNKITIAEHYCNKLHSIKHGLLNSMFI